MCDSASEALPPLPHDEYVLGTDRVRGFVSDVRGHIGAAGSPAEACEALGPLFSDLLADDTWLPVAFQEPVLDSGMGGGIGSGCSSARPTARFRSSASSSRRAR